MPFSWKKSWKFGQIPQLISDLKSRRNRSSLNLETGFPTSLADFIVKNRDRLKKSRKQSEKSFPPASDLVIDAAQAPFVNPSGISCLSPVTRQSPLNTESGSVSEASGRRTEKDNRPGELRGLPLPNPRSSPRRTPIRTEKDDELGKLLGRPLSPPNSMVDLTFPFQGSSLQANKHQQLLLRLPPFKEAAASSSQRSRLEEKRQEKTKPDDLRRRLPPRREVAISSSSDNGSTKNPAKCNLEHTSSSTPESRLERRVEKNKLEQPSPSAVRYSDERAERFKPERLSSSHGSRQEKGKRDKLLRHFSARKLEVFTSSASNENLSPPTKNVSQSDADGELPALPIQRKLSVASMVFFVLVLALRTKEITLVMTLSVFLLFLLESGRKHIYFCRKRREQGKKISAPASKLGSGKEDAALIKDKGRDTSFREIKTESHSMSEFVISNSNNKVKLVDTQALNVGKEGSCYVKEFESMNRKSEVDLVYIEKNVSIQKEGSGNLTAKWKKLVLKKFPLAKGRKFCQDQEETSGFNGELLDCGAGKEEDEDAGEEVDGEGCDTALEGTELGVKNVCLTRKRSVGHPVFFVLVLVGLVGGRIKALILTVAWVLLIKSSEILWNKLKSYRRQESQT